MRPVDDVNQYTSGAEKLGEELLRLENATENP